MATMESERYAAAGQSPSARGALYWLVATITGVVVQGISFFLPWAASTHEYRAELEANPLVQSLGSGGMTNDQIKDLSVYEVMRMYWSAIRLNTVHDDATKTELIICVVIMAIIAVSIILALLFALFRHSIATAIFAVVATLAFTALCWDFNSRGILPTDAYHYGVAYYLFYGMALVAVVASIGFAITRRRSNVRH
jgi:hypothetical protein